MVSPGSLWAQRPLGTDVSGWQPSINWTTVKNGGVAFAWTKATEGTGYTNPYFTTQENGAKGVGILVGAYHFARPSSNPNLTGANSAVSEAAYFWSVASNYVKTGGSYLVPMLDWEDSRVTNQLTAATMSAWVNQWCSTVSNYARLNGIPGMKPVVYTGTWYSRPSATYSGLTTAVTGWPSWIAAYPGNPNPQTGGPSDTYPWTTWNIWQYADTNWSGGDSDVFNGTLTSFVQMFVVGGGTNAPSITTQPTNITVALGSPVTLSVKAAGQPPFYYQWLFNGTNIPNAIGPSYLIPYARLNQAGPYAVMVSNSYSTALSSTAFVSVVGPMTNAPDSVVAPPGLVDWWPADGNGLDIYGTNTAVPYNGFRYAPGKQNMAFRFDGSTSYLSNSASSLPVPWTACFWVIRSNAPGTGAALLSDGSYELKLEQYNTTRQLGVTQFGAGDYSFGYVVPAGTWTHVAFIGTSAGTSLYVNGALQGALTNTLPLPRAYIGAGYAASSGKFVDFMLGNLDEILLFSRALSGTEIQSIYLAGSAGLVRAPEFTGTLPVAPGQVRVSFRGLTGKSVGVYGSLDQVTWGRLATIANPLGNAQFTDTTATNGQSFYRLSQP